MTACVAAHLILTAATVLPVWGTGTFGEQASQSASQASAEAEYRAFRDKFRNWSNDSVSFETRMKLYEKRKAEAEEHNAREDRLWDATVDNQFADYTDDEYRALLGYRRHSAWVPPHSDAKVASFLETRRAALTETLEKVDWSGYALTADSQGGCGSCWAMAATHVVEAHLRIRDGKHADSPRLSVQELVDCVPNPNKCGGDGGCAGATGELALAYISKYGIAFNDEYKSGAQSGGGNACSSNALNLNRVWIFGFTRFATNSHVVRALQQGPLVMSVAAGNWGLYSEGIFDGCPRDSTVNHAVAAYGYGAVKTEHLASASVLQTEHQKPELYYLIQNSWGKDWGENGGYMRLKRFSEDDAEDWSGTDPDSHKGVGCSFSPIRIPIRGMCGCLSDVALPNIEDPAAAATRSKTAAAA